MSMQRARQRGDLPNAPVFRSTIIVLFTVGAAAGAAWRAPWRRLIEVAVEGQNTTYALALSISLRLVLATVLGAISALLIAQLLSAAWAFQMRGRLAFEPEGSPSWVRVGSLLLLPLAAAGTPYAVAHLSQSDAGWAIIYLPLVAIGAALLVCAPLALFERAWAIARWRQRVDPDPPPRRDPDERAPLITAALRSDRSP